MLTLHYYEDAGNGRRYAINMRYCHDGGTVRVEGTLPPNSTHGAASLKPGDAVTFREPLAPHVWTRGTVLGQLVSGTLRILPEGCSVSRVLAAPEDVRRA